MSLTEEDYKKVKLLKHELKTLKGYLRESPHMETCVGICSFYPNDRSIGPSDRDEIKAFKREHEDIFDNLNAVFGGLVINKINNIKKELSKYIKEN